MNTADGVYYCHLSAQPALYAYRNDTAKDSYRDLKQSRKVQNNDPGLIDRVFELTGR